MPVEFVTIDGRATPLHPFGGCSAKAGQVDGGTVRSPESQCIKSQCRLCGATVFFIRHNGGSVFIDPPLGPPWSRHPCMPKQGAKQITDPDRATLHISPETFKVLSRVRGLITGVVVQAEVAKGRKCTILTIAVAQPDPLILQIRGGADYFLGKLVVLRPAKRALYSAGAPEEVFLVERAVFVPKALRNAEFPLLLDRSAHPEGQADAKTKLPTEPLPKAVAKAFRKFSAQGLGSTWKANELVSIVHLLEGKAQDDAVHKAAVLTLEKCIAHGDTTPVLALAKALHPQKRAKLTEWYRTYSPLMVDVSRKDRKIRIARDRDLKILPFDIEGAKANPVFRQRQIGAKN